MDAPLALVIVLALAFAWCNGMHDAANAVATSLSTGALTPRIALGMSAILNVVGALLGVGIAALVGNRLLSLPTSGAGPDVVAVALAVAFAWNIATWWAGMPSSSTQALIGALAGAGLAAGGRVEWAALRRSVVAPMLVSPVVGFLGAWLLMVLLTRYLEDAAHERALRGFRMAQSVTAATVSVGHGLQDAQKTIGAVMIALGSATGLGADGPEAPGPSVPWWLRLSVALALGLGTYAGGWRIIRTLARRLVRITPVSGFAANGVASAVLYAAGGVLGAPVSTTMVVTSAVVGAAVTDGLKVVRWATARAVLLTWVLTPLATFAAAEALMALLIAVT